MSLTIHSRNSWSARKPNGTRTRRPPSSIKELFIHWPGNNPGSWAYLNSIREEKAAIRGIQSHHINGNGWVDIGYNHILVPNYGRPDRVPRIYTARGAQYVPAAQLNHNWGTLAICVLMGPNDEMTPDIKRRLRSYVRWAEDYSGNELRVRPHSAVVNTQCPGPELSKIIRRLDRV